MILVSILAAIAAPGWLSYANRQRINRTQSDLLQALQQAQTQAQQRQATREIEIDVTPGSPAISVAGSRTELGGEQNDQIQLIAPSTTFTFDYKGFIDVDDPDNIPFIIEVASTDNSNNAKQRCVVVTNLLGSMRVADGDGCNAAQYDDDT